MTGRPPTERVRQAVGEEQRAEAPGARERILDATFALLAEEGRDAADMKRITEAAGVKASSVYWFFKDKDDVVLEAVGHGTLEWMRRKFPLPSAEGGLATAAFTLMRHLTDDFSERVDFWRIGLQMSLPRQGGTVARRVVEMRERSGEEVAAWWSAAEPRLDGGTAAALARLTMSAVGALLIARRADAGFPVRVEAERCGQALGELAGRLAGEPEELPAAAIAAAASSAAAASVTAPRPESDETGSRERILAAALAVLAEEGYRGATIARITRRAQVSTSSVYWVCDNKEDLVRQAVGEAADGWYSTVPAFLPLADPAAWPGYLGTGFERYLMANLSAPDFVLAGLQLTLDEHRDGPTAGYTLYRAIHGTVRERTARWLRTTALAGDPDGEQRAGHLALWTHALMDETFTQLAIARADTVPRRHVRMVVALLEALATRR
ncbi:TetR/AcrR family transcriptional regulator [Streptomyces mutabilis]|uniref:TetR/AcrR family transcriptional regulator n=1 Tax=Streptomyces mutabilis TaxID=67332 RepID=UPI00365DD3A5